MSTVTDELLLRIAVTGGAVAASEVAAFEDRIVSADAAAARATKRFNIFHGVLRQFGAVGAGFMLYDAVKQFSQFQRQMEMLHTQTGATQQEVGRATKAIMNMAVSVGTGPNSLAQALYHIESTQVRGKRAYNELRIAAEGAQVGQANLVDTTNALNAILVGKLIPATGGFKAAMGQLNATVGSGDMYMQDLASAYSTGILSSMKRVGLQLIDVNAAMATLGDNNIRGTQAANRLRMGLLQIVKPTNAAANELHGLHMGTHQLAEDYYKPNGLYVMLQDLHRHLDKLSKTKQNDVLMSLFGRGRMSAGIMTLYDQMGRLHSKYVAITEGAKNFGNAWKGTRRTFGFLMDQIKAFVDVWLIKLGAAIAHFVTGPFAKFINGLRHGKTWAIAIAAGLGALVLVFGGLSVAVAAFGAVLTVVQNIPIILVITAIIFAIIELIRNWKSVKEAALDAWHWIENAVSNVWSWIKDHWPLVGVILLAPFIAFAGWIVALPAAIIAIVLVIINFIKHNFHGLYKIMAWPFQQVWGVIKDMANAVVSIFRWLFDKVSKIVSHLLRIIKPVVDFFGGLLHIGGNVLGSVGNFLGLTGGGSHPSSASVSPSSPTKIFYLPRGNYVAPNAPAGHAQPTQVPLEATIHNYNILDGKVVSKQMVRQGLMATARRGAGGPTLSDAG